MCMCVYVCFHILQVNNNVLLYMQVCSAHYQYFTSRLTHLISSYFTATIFFEIGSIIMLTLLFVHKGVYYHKLVLVQLYRSVVSVC